MRTSRLRTKILLILLMVFAVVITTMFLSMGHLFQMVFTSQRLNELQHLAEEAARRVQISPSGAAYAGPSPAPGNSMLVLDDTGALLHAEGAPLPDVSTGWLPGFDHVLQGRTLTVKTSVAPLFEPSFVIGVPVGTPPRAALYLVEPAASGDWVIRKMNQVMLLAAIGALLLAGGVALIIADRMARPLIRLERMTARMMQGDFSTEISVRGRDEAASLARSINQLSRHLNRVREDQAEFLTNVSHDLRTPITHIQGYAQILAEGVVASEEEQQNYLRVIREETARLQHLLDDLLELARYQESELRMDRQTVDLTVLLENVCAKLQPFAARKGVALEYEAPQSALYVQADLRRIEQAVINLLHNAIRHVTEGGHVRVKVGCSLSQVMVTVEDDGSGIPQKDLPHIWERFYRVEKSRNRSHGGTGVGLSIVKQIIEAHQGHVHAESEPGEGTSISFVLPREGRDRT